MKLIKLCLIITCLWSLSACKHWWGGADDETSNPFQGVPAKTLYTDAKKSLSKKEYTAAIKRLEALDILYPFNDYAEQAGLDLIYAYYKKDDYPSTVVNADRYIHLYPRAKNVDYAYYMKGLANFKQDRGGLANMVAIDTSWRNPGTQSQAYADFSVLVEKFPSSRYKANAMQRMIYLRNEFAQHELNIARFYYERKMYVAAAERANYLLTTYSQAPSAEGALVVLYHANKQLGLTQAANDAKAIYEATYHKVIAQEVPKT